MWLLQAGNGQDRDDGIGGQDKSEQSIDPGDGHHGGYCAFVAARGQADADLQALIDAGRGDVPLVRYLYLASHHWEARYR